MARPLRIEYEGASYHVTARGNEKKNIFHSDPDFKRFRWYMLEAKERFGCLYHAYALMPNHYHLLIETPEANLNRVIHYLNSSYAAYYNVKYDRVGHLFQGRYKGILVDRDSYFLELSRYLHLNPVRAGLVKRPEDYRYCSYQAYIEQANDPLVSTETIIGMMRGTGTQSRGLYLEFIDDGIGIDLENPTDQTIGQIILGSEEFVKQALKRIDGHWMESSEIAHRKDLPIRMSTEEILKAVCESYGISRDDCVTGKNPESKVVAIYLMRIHTGMTNAAIGNTFIRMSYSAVSQAYRRFKRRMDDHPHLQQMIHSISQMMSNVKV